ncbi:MAG: anaerobic ribonucleoside-triphosphate reductase activating protein [Sarcina sp.]
MIKIKYATIKPFDTANAPGISSSIYFSGCKFLCEGCFNSIAQDFNYGQEYTKEVEDKLIEYLKHPEVKNACLLGGEVFQQDLNTILNLVKRIKNETNVKIWLWTGYLYENLLNDINKIKILNYIDTLIDGQFVLSKKKLNLKYRGSSNQRVVLVQESLKQNKIIEMEME